MATAARRLAAPADVLLGSVTYRFEDMDELLTGAFTHLADTVAARLAERLAATSNSDEEYEAGSIAS